MQIVGNSFKVPKPPRKLESMCRKALYDFDLLENVDQLAIALSGGKDSLTLLFLLKAILGNGFPMIPLTAIHVSGEFSCGAGIHSSYLQKYCEAIEVELVTIAVDQRPETLNCYSCSRKRRSLIFDEAKKRGIKTIGFGHHRDDSIQTLLLNLLHKAEFAANLPKVPMIDYGVTIIRPLLYVSEHAIREFAQNEGFARVMCQCPIGQNSMRKKAEGLLNEMQEIFPNARENLAQASLQYGSTKALKK
jgi:tRNA 2-thiocytidine biosynthesis protein TtcA